jgi:hypothetical protein
LNIDKFVKRQFSDPKAATALPERDRITGNLELVAPELL